MFRPSYSGFITQTVVMNGYVEDKESRIHGTHHKVLHPGIISEEQQSDFASGTGKVDFLHALAKNKIRIVLLGVHTEPRANVNRRFARLPNTKGRD